MPYAFSKKTLIEMGHFPVAAKNWDNIQVTVIFQMPAEKFWMSNITLVVESLNQILFSSTL